MRGLILREMIPIQFLLRPRYLMLYVLFMMYSVFLVNSVRLRCSYSETSSPSCSSCLRRRALCCWFLVQLETSCRVVVLLGGFSGFQEGWSMGKVIRRNLYYFEREQKGSCSVTKKSNNHRPKPHTNNAKQTRHTVLNFPLQPVQTGAYEKRSVAWKFFTPINDEIARCIECGITLGTKGGTTSGLLNHMRKKHPQAKQFYDLVIEEKKKNRMKDNLFYYQESRVESVKERIPQQRRMPNRDWISYLICKDKIPVHVLEESQFFKQAFRDYNISPRENLEKAVVDFFGAERDQLRKEFLGQVKAGQKFNLEVEWKLMRNNKRYVSLIVYGFNAVPIRLGIRRIFPPINSQALMNAIKSKLTQFGLNFQRDIFVMVTKNSQTNQDMVQQAGKPSMKCLLQGLHQVVNNVIFCGGKGEKKWSVVEHSSEVENYDFGDELEDLEEGDMIIDKNVRDIIHKVRILVARFKQSPLPEQKLKQMCQAQKMDFLQLVLQIDQNWLTLYLMLARFFDLKELIQILLEENSMAFNFTQKELTEVKKLRELLQIPYYLMKSLEQVTFSTTIIQVRGVIEVCLSQLNANINYPELRKKLAQEIQKMYFRRTSQDLYLVGKYLSKEFNMLDKEKVLDTIKGIVNDHFKNELEEPENNYESEYNFEVKQEDMSSFGRKSQIGALFMEVYNGTKKSVEVKIQDSLTTKLQDQMSAFELKGQKSRLLSSVEKMILSLPSTVKHSSKVFNLLEEFIAVKTSRPNDSFLQKIIFLHYVMNK